MFRIGTASARSHPGRPLRRAAYLAVALLLVWFATQLLPGSSPLEPRAYSDEAGTVVLDRESEARIASDDAHRLLTPGRIAALLLLGLGGATALVLRRRRATPSDEKATLRTVGKLQLAPGQQLHLIECGDDLLLLGATGSQISLLKTLGRPDEPARNARTGYRRDEVVRPAADGSKGPAFSAILRSLNNGPSTAHAANAS